MDDVVKNQILDPAIKLFGKSIQLPESNCVEAEPRLTSDAGEDDDDDDVDERRSCEMDSGLEDESDNEGTVNGEEYEEEQENSNSQKVVNQRKDTSGTERIIEKSMDESKGTILCSQTTEEENNSNGLPNEKTLKKPDKIIPCPRCDSMDTKFCYFNNYNVNQPRYFCRKCQRYWTSGGTMRNLPVGAGRRKSKSSTVHHYPTIAQLGDFPNANGTIHRPVALNGPVLSFALDQPCPPNGVDLARLVNIQNGSTNPVTEAEVLIIDDNTTGSAGSVSNVENEDEYKAKADTSQCYQSFQPQMMCYPSPPLWPPFPWNSAQYNYPLPGPINVRSGFPMPFYPAPIYVGCALPGTWNIPWSNTQPDPKSPTLGKRPRDDSVTKRSDGPKPSLWVPKTLRIDDLEETAKSSMLAKLGIKTDNICKPFFSSLANETSQPMTTSSLLANPAALSRSMNFHESS